MQSSATVLVNVLIGYGSQYVSCGQKRNSNYIEERAVVRAEAVESPRGRAPRVALHVYTDA